MGTPIKVVLDTNVIVSALLWQGKTSLIFNLAEEGKIIICISVEIIDELSRALKYPKLAKQLSTVGKSSDEIVAEFLEVVEYYYVPALKSVIITKDPDDDKFIACAIAARASFIVTGDKEVLRLCHLGNIDIVTPSAFLRRFKL